MYIALLGPRTTRKLNGRRRFHRGHFRLRQHRRNSRCFRPGANPRRRQSTAGAGGTGAGCGNNRLFRQHRRNSRLFPHPAPVPRRPAQLLLSVPGQRPPRPRAARRRARRCCRTKRRPAAALVLYPRRPAAAPVPQPLLVLEPPALNRAAQPVAGNRHRRLDLLPPCQRRFPPRSPCRHRTRR